MFHAFDCAFLCFCKMCWAFLSGNVGGQKGADLKSVEWGHGNSTTE